MVINAIKPTLSRGGMNEVRSFRSLHVGDRAMVMAEVIHIRADPAHTPPKWWLLNLYDGETSIKVFNSANTLSVGEYVLAELDVTEGKPFKNQRQFAYKLRAIQKVEAATPQYAEQLSKIAPREVLRKAELQQLPAGTRVKLFTHLLDITPKTKGKFRKLLLTDIANVAISLWFPMEDLPVFENITPEEFFILKAFIQTVPNNPAARYLALESVVRGAAAYRDPLTQKVLDQQIQDYLQKARETLQQKMQYADGPQDKTAALLLSLQSFQAELTQPSPAGPPSPSPAEGSTSAQTIKFTCRQCQQVVTRPIYKIEDIPAQCPACHTAWSSFNHTFQYEVVSGGLGGK